MSDTTPEQTPPLAPDITLSFEITLNDLLSAAWAVRSHRHNRLHLVAATDLAPTRRQRLRQSLIPFAQGVGLGMFHLTAASIVLMSALNAVGHLRQFTSQEARWYQYATILVGFIWLWLLAGPSILRKRMRTAALKRWRSDIPEIFQGPLPATLKLSATRVQAETLGDQTSAPLGPAVKLVETADHCLLTIRGFLVPIAKTQPQAHTIDAVRSWAAAHDILFRPARQRHIRLSPPASQWAGATLLVICLWSATNLKIQPNPEIYPTAATLTLPDATTVVAGQIVNLDHLAYTASAFNGVLYDQLSIHVNRPEISGYFHIDRSATPYLAQTAEDEFALERTWDLTIGKMPDTAAMEPLPDSGVLITWDNPPGAAYAGHCGALRTNPDAIPAGAGRVLWRSRLYLQLCSATMSKPDLRDWMFQALPPMERQLPYLTQTKR